MRNVLADLALESEGALALTMRIAGALDHRHNPHEDLLVRLVTTVGKLLDLQAHARMPTRLWVHRRQRRDGGQHVPAPVPKPPVNAIWEELATSSAGHALRAMSV